MGNAEQQATMRSEMNHSETDGTMQAITQDAYGPVDVLKYGRTAKPEIADDEVLVRVHAAGLDRGTWHMMAGKPYLLRVIGFGLRKPKNNVPGLDVAGIVAAVGSAVTRFSVSDEVYGMSRGAFAEYASVREDKLALKPANLTFAEAAAVPISGGTALQAMGLAGVKAGQQVLITGASGGVGSYAVQLAKSLGAEVTAVASSSKLDLMRSLGADHVMDYTKDDFADGARKYDVIIDIAGNPTLSRLRRALTPKGTAVIVGGEEGGNVTGGFGRSLRAGVVSMFVSQRLAMLASKERATDLERLTPLIEGGKVTPSIDRTYPLNQVPDAMRHLIAGNVRGKVAITI